MFPHRNIQKYTWTYPYTKTHNPVDQGLIKRRWHSNILDTRFSREADFYTDFYVEAVKVKKRLSASKLAAKTFDLERFNLKKLSEAAFLKYLSSIQRIFQSFFY